MILLNPDCDSCGCRGLGRAYVGGHFTTIGGDAATRLAMLDRSGVLVAGFVCALGGGDPAVLYIDEANGLLWVGGDFTTVNGGGYTGLVAVDWNTGTVVYAPTLSGNFTGTTSVQGLSYDAASGFLYVNGDFKFCNGTACTGAVRFYLGQSPSLDTSWLPVLDGLSENARVFNSTVYLAGNGFSTLNGAARAGVGAVDEATGLVNTSFDPIRFGGARDILVRSPTSAFLVGNFTSLNPGVPRRSLAEVDATTGTPTSWDPGASILNTSGKLLASAGATGFFCAGAFTTVAGGTARRSVAEFLDAGALDTTFSQPLVATRCDWVHLGTDGRLYVCMAGGGDNGVFALSTVDGSVFQDWLPAANNECFCIATTSTPP